MGRQVTIHCDIDGPDTAAAGTVRFGWEIVAGGRKTRKGPLDIDLSDAHLARFEAILNEFADAARRAETAPPAIRKPAKASALKKASAPPPAKAEPAAPPPVAEPAEAATEHEWETPPGVTPAEAEQWATMRRDARDWALVNGWPKTRRILAYAAYPAWKQAMGWSGDLFAEWQAWQAAEGEHDGQGTLSLKAPTSGAGRRGAVRRR